MKTNLLKIETPLFTNNIFLVDFYICITRFGVALVSESPNPRPRTRRPVAAVAVCLWNVLIVECNKRK